MTHFSLRYKSQRCPDWEGAQTHVKEGARGNPAALQTSLLSSKPHQLFDVAQEGSRSVSEGSLSAAYKSWI